MELKQCKLQNSKLHRSQNTKPELSESIQNLQSCFVFKVTFHIFPCVSMLVLIALVMSGSKAKVPVVARAAREARVLVSASKRQFCNVLR